MLLVAGLASADAVRLHPAATTDDHAVRLADIAELHGPAAEALADTVVADWPDVVTRSRLSLAEVREALAAAGANFGLLSIEGPPHCVVEIVPAASETSVVPPASDAEPDLELHANVAFDAGHPAPPGVPTLRGEIVERLILATGLPRNDVRVTFHNAAGFLDEPIAGPTRLRPTTTATLGAVPIVVEALDDLGYVAKRRDVIAIVERRVAAVVATRTLRADRPLRADDVERVERWIDRADGEPLAELSQAVGLRLGHPVQEGHAIYPDHIQKPYVIRRGDLVNVRVVAAGMVVRSVGVATHDAVVGEPVDLRRPRTREGFTATAVGPQEATIRLNADDADGTAGPEHSATTPSLDALAATVDRLEQGYLNR
jgi:flagella basal body P-ring formation protein FlgA